MKHRILAAIRKVIIASYNAWRNLTEEEIKQEYAWEYSKVKRALGDVFPTLQDFQKAVSAGTPKKISKSFDSNIEYRSRCSTIEELKELVSGYQFPRDVDRILKGLETNSPMPYPLVLKIGARYRIMSGNTRMDTAFISGVEPTALIITVDKKP